MPRRTHPRARRAVGTISLALMASLAATGHAHAGQGPICEDNEAPVCEDPPPPATPLAPARGFLTVFYEPFAAFVGPAPALAST